MNPEDVSDELVDIFARKFWAIPREQLTRGSQDAARVALAPVLAEYEKPFKTELDILRAAADPVKTGAVERLVRSMTRLVTLERDDARAQVEQLTARVDKAEERLAAARTRMHDLAEDIAAADEHKAELAEARAAIERVRALHSREDDPRRTPDCKGCRTVATYTLHEDCKTLAALDAPQRAEDTRERPKLMTGNGMKRRPSEETTAIYEDPEDARTGVSAETCPRCDGSRFEPGTEADGDWDSAAMRHHPYTGEPCTACNGTGTPSPVSAATEAQGTPHDPAECIPCWSRAKHQEGSQ